MDICLPRLGEGTDSGTIVVVLVKKGDAIRIDQPILEFENEKTVASVPSTADGIVSELYVQPGDKLSVGQRILSLAGDVVAGHESVPGAETETAPEPSSNYRTQNTKLEMYGQNPMCASESGDGSQQLEIDATPNLNPAASPSIRKLADELGIDLTRVHGSAQGGRIIRSDLKSYIQALQANAFAKKPGSS